MGRRRKPKDMQKAHLTQAEKERREEEERTVSTGNEPRRNGFLTVRQRQNGAESPKNYRR